jgi:hypothetical protein
VAYPQSQRQWHRNGFTELRSWANRKKIHGNSLGEGLLKIHTNDSKRTPTTLAHNDGKWDGLNWVTEHCWTNGQISSGRTLTQDERFDKWQQDMVATEPDVGRVAHGVPSRVDRLRGLGNAVVPQVAELIGRMVIDYDTNDVKPHFYSK